MSRCNCLESVRDELKQNYEEREDIEKVDIVSIENTAVIFTEGSCQMQVYSPVKVEYDYKNKKGEIKHKKEKANMAYVYCPFCGKKYGK